jgi:hypothetical protein
LLWGWHHWHRLFLWLMDNHVVRQLHLWSHLAWRGRVLTSAYLPSAQSVTSLVAQNSGDIALRRK